MRIHAVGGRTVRPGSDGRRQQTPPYEPGTGLRLSMSGRLCGLFTPALFARRDGKHPHVADCERRLHEVSVTEPSEKNGKKGGSASRAHRRRGSPATFAHDGALRCGPPSRRMSWWAGGVVSRAGRSDPDHRTSDSGAHFEAHCRQIPSRRPRARSDGADRARPSSDDLIQKAGHYSGNALSTEYNSVAW